MHDPEALIQTGAGVPDWSWRSVTLSWNGPVERSQRLALWLMPPWLRLALCVARAILLALAMLLLVDLRRLRPAAPAPQGPGKDEFSFAPAAGALTLLALLAAGPARAEHFPPQAMLDQLKARLLEPAECFPACVASPRLDILARDGRLTLALEANAAARTSLPLPMVSAGGLPAWLPESVSLDEQTNATLTRRDGKLWLLVPRDAHRVVVSGPLPESVSFTVSLALRPCRGRVVAPGYEVQGWGKDGTFEANVQLARAEVKSNPEAAARAGRTVPIPFFLGVERTLILGLNWEVRTTVRRLTASGEPVVCRIPLLPGESALSTDVEIQGDKALVNMGSRDDEVSWSSSLERSARIELTAPQTLSWVETWVLEPASIWRVELQGIPMVESRGPDGLWRPEWRPWPGESVRIDVSRPAAAPGEFLTMDSARYVFTPGDVIDDNELTLRIRASKGARRAVTLPPGAQVSSLAINGKETAWTPAGPQQVGFAVSPGEQTVALAWRSGGAATGFPAVLRTPAVDLGFPAVNVDLEVQLPRDRWTLFTWNGTLLGPAVRFWSYLGALLVAALCLGFIPWTPLKRYEWFLLGLGLSQAPPPAAVLAVAWLLALGLRRNRWPRTGWFGFNFMQVALAGLVITGLGCVYTAIEQGLLGLPEMQVAGNDSSAFALRWSLDRTLGKLPQPVVLTAPLWLYRAAMLLWSLWMAAALLRWLKWGWICFNEGGVWRTPDIRRPHFRPREEPHPVMRDTDRPPAQDEPDKEA